MNVKKNWKDQIRGWIPKEPFRISAQTSRTVNVFMIVIMAVLIVPIFYLVIQATNYLGIFWPISILPWLWFHVISSTKQALKLPFPPSRKE